MNVLANSPKISHMTKTHILQLNFTESDEKYDKDAVMQISEVFGTF